jgi:hypothetical protein
MQLKDRLAELVDKTTGLQAIVGFTSLTCISLALPELNANTLPQFLMQFGNITNFISFAGPKAAPFLLICTTIFWYYRYKGAAIKEMNLIGDVFEEDRAPIRLEGLDQYRLIAVIGYVLVGTYCALILLAPYLSYYCLAALVLHATDLTGASLAIQNLNRAIAKFPLTTDGGTAKFTKERREVVKQYYLDNPTLPRIGLIFIVTAVILALSLRVPPEREYLGYLLYALMIANILFGEYVIGKWRAVRDAKLDAIDVRQEEAGQSEEFAEAAG